MLCVTIGVGVEPARDIASLLLSSEETKKTQDRLPIFLGPFDLLKEEQCLKQ
jgi:hypothetical protein